MPNCLDKKHDGGYADGTTGSSHCSSGSRFWIVTVDSNPMPWEINQYPFQIVYGTESFVKSFCESLNSMDGDELYEYSEVSNQEIYSENY